MCNYKYKFNRDRLSGESCIYPSFYTEYADLFPTTKTLAVDHEGLCIFHSGDEAWKIENGFAEKFEELLNVTTAICENARTPKSTFNFSGFYFVTEKGPLTLTNLHLKDAMDLRFCKFVTGLVIENSTLNSIALDSAHFHGPLKLSNVTFSNNIYFSYASFDKGIALVNCRLKALTYFDHCTFKNQDNRPANAFIFNEGLADFMTFEDSTFEAPVTFQHIVFTKDVMFDRATFLDEFYFHYNEVRGIVSFKATSFLLSENANPMYSSVDFAELNLAKSGRLLFHGAGPMDDMVRGELQMNCKPDPEGLISFENFNLNKIYPASKARLLSWEKTGQVEIGKGCRKYYCQTGIFEKKATRPDQQLILDMVKVFCNYFDIHNHYNLGLEIVERNPDLIRYFFFTDEIISDDEFMNRIRQNEYDLWQTFANLSGYAGEQQDGILVQEKNTLIDLAAIFLKIRNRILSVNDYFEKQFEELVTSTSIDGIPVIEVNSAYKAIMKGFESFYRQLPAITINVAANEPGSKDFISDFIEGIQRLQSNDNNEICISNIRNKIFDESPFRYWFMTWFSARGYHAEAEPEKGSGRIDLKASHTSIGKKIIEFKGWWNRDKRQVVGQVCNYLTEFEGDGYIFMINHNKSRDIVNGYKKLILDLGTGYKINTWERILFSPTDFAYYKSVHKIGTKEKCLYHFIYSVY